MVKYHMRRTDRDLAAEADIADALRQGKNAIIAMCRQEEPYIVTLSYGYDEGRKALYFHCAQDGLKMDFIKANPNVCATVFEDDGFVAGRCKYRYRSLVIRGRMSIVDSADERRSGMDTVMRQFKYETEPAEHAAINEALARITVLRLDIEEITGKRSV